MKKPKVLVDARMVGRPPTSGIGRYALAIAQALSKRALPYDVEFMVSRDLENELQKEFFPFRVIPSEVEFLSLKECSLLQHLLAKNSFSLFHNVSFSAIAVPENLPYLMTLHDLNHLHFGNILQKAYYLFLVRPVAIRAAKLLTVSQFARQEIAFWLDQDQKTMDIIPAPCTSETYRTGSNLAGSNLIEPLGQRNYFLLISNPKKHKNCELLFQAYSKYRKKIENPFLLYSNVEPIETDLKDGVTLVKPTDSELLRLIKNARTFLFPSLYEGYGMGFREALSLGTPVIVSDIPPHREGFTKEEATRERSWLRFVPPQVEVAWVNALIAAHIQEFSVVPASAISRFQTEFGLKVFGDKIDHAYRTVLGLSP